jgi:hypothetical protein
MLMQDTVVVIGSGPASSGMVGASIDRHRVVRMCNHDWQPADRYGSRYDYGVITSLDDARAASRRPAKAWFFYPPSKGTRRDAAALSQIDGTDIIVVNHEKWFAQAMQMGAKSATSRALKFTRGFAAVAGSIECLRPKRVVIVGMDILRNGATGAKYYDPAALPFYVQAYPNMATSWPAWAADELAAGVTRDGPHDYAAEAALIRKLAAEAGTELVWDGP